MISIEAARDGFVVSVGGQRLLVHGRRSPCIEIGRAEISFHRGRGGLCARRKRSSWLSLRDFSVITNGPELTVIDFGGILRMSFHREDEDLRLGFACSDPSYNLFRIRLQAQVGEHIYGLGEGGAPLDLKGRSKALWVAEKGRLHGGRGGRIAAQFRPGTSGEKGFALPIPAFVSSRNYWCALDSPAWSVFDFRRRSTTSIETWTMPSSIVVGSRPTAPETVRELRRVLGAQPLLPSWVFDGICLGLGSGSMEGELEAALAAGVKLSSVWTDGLEAGKPGSGFLRPSWDCAAGPAFERDLRPQVRLWRERGIRWLGFADPYLDRQGPLYAEASSKGWLVKSPLGGDYVLQVAGGHLALVDLSHPEARAWLKGLLASSLLGLGAGGWLADSGGLLPADAVLHSGEDARLVHNLWPLLWAGLSNELIQESGKARELFFGMRSGWLGSGALLPAAYAGEISLGFGAEDGLPGLVPAALSLGLTGISSFHAEVGGRRLGQARQAKARECLWRWMELAAFSPVFRSRSPEAGDSDFLHHLARMSDIHAALKPYHEAVAGEGQDLGLPDIRHPYLHYEDEEELHHRDWQYLYGRDLLVAPSLAAGAELTEVFLPADDWVHLWSSRNFHGGLVTVDSPLGFPAVFYRSSSPYAALFDSIRRTARRL